MAILDLWRCLSKNMWKIENPPATNLCLPGVLAVCPLPGAAPACSPSWPLHPHAPPPASSRPVETIPM